MGAGSGFDTPLWRDRRAWTLAALALLTYLPGLAWGLPAATSEAGLRGWDVDGITGIGPLAELHNLLVEAKPDWFVAYPLFHYLLLGACTAPYLAWLWLSGGLAEPSPGYPYGFADPAGSIAALSLIGRSLTLAMGVGTVLAAYQAARLVWERRTGLFAALFVMWSGPMVYRARTGNLDVPSLFWTALGVVALAAVCARGLTLRRAAAVGACAALATATKDQAYGGWVAVILLLGLLHALRRLPRAEPDAAARWKAPAAAVLSGAVVYALASGIPLWPGRFLAHMDFILGYEEARFAFEALDLRRARDPAGLLALGYDVVRTVCVALGLPVAAMAAAGLAEDRRSGAFHALLAAMAVGYLALVIVPIAHMQYRYALLPAFLLAFPAARWLACALEGSRARRRLALGLAALGFAWLLGSAASLTWQMRFDARYAAGDWLSAHLSPGDRVGFFGDKGQLPALPAGVEVERLPGGPGSLEQIRSAKLDALLVIPDYTAPEGVERSLFLSREAERALEAGALPYTLAERFVTPAPGGVRFPFVNPPVRIYVRHSPDAASRD